MNDTDTWQEFADEFAAQSRWTPEQMDAAADEYQREQIATAQSEDAHAANVRSYNK